MQAWLKDGTLTPGFSVSGHSLGGYLAAGLVADFSASISHAWLYNAPGNNSLVSQVMQALGIVATPDTTKITSLRADAGISPIAGLGNNFSPPIPIHIENQFDPGLILSAPGAMNHSQQVLTDSLALYNLFAKVDPAISVGTITAILQASSNSVANTLESALAAVGKLYGKTYPTGQTTRDILYSNLNDLQGAMGTGGTIVPLTGAASGIAAQAKTDIATRYALKELNPFALTGVDYSQFNQNGELNLYDPATGSGTLTELYLEDRAAMLSWKMLFDTQDKSYGADFNTVSIAGDWDFIDRATLISGAPLKLTIDGVSFGSATHQILFGSGQDDTGATALTGGDNTDHLYGMGGADTLQGNGGADYLEGGSGNDTYVYQTGDGLDTLLDSDGQGSIAYDGATLAGGDQYGDARVHRDADKHLYVDVGQGLVIDGNLMIQNYQNGNLGLNLSTTTAADPVTTGQTINGDLALPNMLEGSAGNDTIIAGGVDDFLYGYAGDDRLYGGAGLDYLDGEAGDDRLYADTQVDTATAIAQGNAQSGSGREGDWLNGGAGNDILVGNSDNNFLAGGAGDDLIIAGAGDDALLGDVDSVAVSFPGQTWHYDTVLKDIVLDYKPGMQAPLPTTSGNDVLYAGAGNDIAFGGYGNDVIYGEGDDDILQGNSGNDVLIGGTGIDYLYGDLPENYATLATPGNDYLDGGAEDDFIYGNEGDDILIGGTGSDTLDGGTGQDTYIYNVGDGVDTIYDTKADKNILRFGTGVNKDNIKLYLGSLMLDLGNGDAIHIDGFDRNDVFNSSSISSFEFADGSSLTTTELLARGFDIDGTAGDDILIGTNITDRINGLSGNDTLDGGDGSDSYLFNRGDGTDTLTDNGDLISTDTLQFGADILQSDVTITRLGNGDLSFKLNGSTDEVVVQGYYNNALNLIERVVFGDGSVMTTEDFAGIDSMSGGEGNDVLYGGMFQYGGEGDDVLYGGVYQYGGNGNDTLTYGQLLSGGAGDDTMDGDDYDTGKTTRYLIDPAQAGIDLIHDTGDSGEAYKEWYYNAQGIQDWQTRDRWGGYYTSRSSSSDTGYFTYQELTDPNNWLSVAFANHPDDLLYIEPLPPVDWPAANDYAALQSAYDAGALPMDTVEFAEGITLSDLQLSWGEVTRLSPVSWMEEPYRTLILSWNGGASQVQLVIPHADDPLGSGVEQIKFSDNTIVGMQTLIAMAPAGVTLDPVNAGLTLIGTEAADVLTGQGGNDTLIGLSGNDTLNGGAGNDTLDGGTGSDTYLFGANSGQDTIVEVVDPLDSGAIDKIVFGAGIALAGLTIERGGVDNNDLNIVITGSNDSLTIQGWFNPASPSTVKQFGFFDGSTLDIETLFNHAPTVSNASLDQSTLEDELFNFTIPAGTFIDIDQGDVLTYTATLADGTALPGWMTFDAATQTFSGTPANGDVGSLGLKVTAIDGSAASASTAFSLEVQNVNDAPVLITPWGNSAAIEDAVFTFTVPAEAFADVDPGDSLIYSATLADSAPLPAWLAFDPATRTFSGTPSNGDVGTVSISVTATDQSGASASGLFDLGVVNTNDAPVVSSTIADQNTAEDAVFSFTVPADAFTDMDVGDALSYTATLPDGTPLPHWLVFDPAARTFSGTPANDDVRSLDVMVTATDLVEVSASSTFVLAIANVNDTPVLVQALSDLATMEDVPFSFTVSADIFTDADFIHGDSLIYSATVVDGSALPSWLNFDAVTQTFSGTPANADVGAIEVKVVATDTGGLAAAGTFSITMENVNDVPVATIPLADQTTKSGDAFLYQLPANAFTDIDAGDRLTYSATLADGSALPSWLNIGPATGDFSGVAAGPAASFQIKVTATDLAGAAASESFTLDVINTAPITMSDASMIMEDSTLPATGNALANDYDPDAGTVLSVADAGVRQGSLGILTLSGDGSYRYDLANTSAAVQSLGAGQSVIERFDYQASDGIAATPGELAITVMGQNDIPVLVISLADRQAAVNTDISWQLPAGSFADVDQGDTLSYSAQLADGNALPSWLTFDAATQTFSGHVPKGTKGSMDIQVVASDGHGAQSVASDVFQVSFTNDHCGGHGNEGVGNGWDAPPPGHDHNWNDGPGTLPGHPGSQGGRGDEERSRHGKGKSRDDDHGEGSDRGDRNKLFSQSYLDLKKLDKHYEEFTGTRKETDTSATVARWIEVDLAVSRRMAMEDKSLPWLHQNHGADIAALHQASAGFLGSKLGFGVDAVSLAAAAPLKTFRGLREGMERIG
ncbi:MAG: putative Ig domain-containing protein [Sulfuricella sp.]